MDDLKARIAEKLAPIQDLIIRELGPRIFAPRGATETPEAYAERVKRQDAILTEMVNKDNMKIWIRVFIHSSSDPEFNYDSLEAIGDKLLGYVVLEYIRARFLHEFGRDINALEFTSAGRNLNNNEFFGKLADSLGLPKLLISYEDVVLKTKGDMFEALVGALNDVGDRIGVKYNIPKLGFQLVQNFVTTFYKDLRLRERYDEYFGKDPKTIVIQIYRQLKWTTSSGSTKPIKNSKTFMRNEAGNSVPVINITIGLTPEAADWFTRRGQTVAAGHIIGTGEDDTKSLAERKAFAMALQNLRNAGLTDERVEFFKNEMRTNETREYLLKKTSPDRFPRDLVDRFNERVAPYIPYSFEYAQHSKRKYGFLLGTDARTKKLIYLAQINLPNDVKYGDDRLINLLLMSKFVTGTIPEV